MFRCLRIEWPASPPILQEVSSEDNFDMKKNVFLKMKTSQYWNKQTNFKAKIIQYVKTELTF